MCTQHSFAAFIQDPEHQTLPPALNPNTLKLKLDFCRKIAHLAMRSYVLRWMSSPPALATLV